MYNQQSSSFRYIITYTGKVWSIRSKKFLKLKEMPRKYLYINLYTPKPKNYLVHRLVAQTYLKDQNFTLQVNHKDGNKQNNHIDNLEMVTNEQNMQHAYNILGFRPGICNRTLVADQVNLIITLYKTGKYSQYQLAKQFSLAQSTISEIINFKRYKDQIQITNYNEVTSDKLLPSLNLTLPPLSDKLIETIEYK